MHQKRRAYELNNPDPSTEAFHNYRLIKNFSTEAKELKKMKDMMVGSESFSEASWFGINLNWNIWTVQWNICWAVLIYYAGCLYIDSEGEMPASELLILVRLGWMSIWPIVDLFFLKQQIITEAFKLGHVF